MGSFAGPKRDTRNLKYCFDAANVKCYNGSNTVYNVGGPGTGTMVNATVGSDGSGCFQFNGTNALISTNVDVSFDEATDMTLLVWAKTDDLEQTAGGIVGKPNPGWEWGFRQGGTTNNGMLFVVWNTGGGHSNVGIPSTSDGFDDTDTWVHFAVVSDGVTLKIYKNGSEIISETYSDASINQDRSNGVQLGGNIYAWGETWWGGKLGTTYILNHALTADEIVSDFNNTKSRYSL